ncbi:hypothetical protein PVAND_015019 [Polypedilum vanderplanki]|uniref:Uncharacterized protein n=1 Tax=Polypedilum vanderplanki TaxID=319348 RepID=A0A9J6BAW0_POLVA|nr:hypothetical protein PVAND_015019 [Polypedilum vanderplanki]
MENNFFKQIFGHKHKSLYWSCNFDTVIINIHNDAEHFYAIGIQNSGLEFDEQIDLESIFNSRTIDHRNVVDISVHNSIVFETAYTASKVVGTIIQLSDYKELLLQTTNLMRFRNILKTRSHAIICSSEQRHFITVFKIKNIYYVFDGLPNYCVTAFENILLPDYEETEKERENEKLAAEKQQNNDDSIDPESLEIFENSEEIRNHIEDIIRKRYEKKGN